jgi:hypothetical protein
LNFSVSASKPMRLSPGSKAASSADKGEEELEAFKIVCLRRGYQAI